MLNFACNKAALGTGFGRQQFLSYAERFAKKHKKQFKEAFGNWRNRNQVAAKDDATTKAVNKLCFLSKTTLAV